MSAKEVDASRKISNVRIHVERVFGWLTKFRILQSNIPMTQVKLLSDIMTIIVGLVNLNNSVVSKYIFFYKQSIFDPRPENCLNFSKKSP